MLLLLELDKMNEQFDKMIYESGLIAQGCWDKLDEYDREALNKFAELIVRECARQVNYYEALNIFEHFGVEE